MKQLASDTEVYNLYKNECTYMSLINAEIAMF